MTTSGLQAANSDISPTEPPLSGNGGTEGDRVLRGSDLARAALQAAKEAAGNKRKAQSAKGKVPHTGSRKRRRWSGAGADSRDPQKFGALLGKIAAERGWNGQLANGEVFGRWTAIVGAEIAEHAKPLTLRDGELTVQASSTAWATQLRLLQRQLLAKIAKGVGDGVVKRLKVHGPAAPSWRYGPRHVAGRGPRDTYG
ncbi:DciA family protein [Actinosynnema sp. ALI-1.44]|uniref:DciA family protein n=1 Tax=Actinosynnema sp. ALI-1.44 TaxID=1933779 RepID=UPI003F8D83FC